MFGFHETFTPEGPVFEIFEFDKDRHHVFDVGDGSFDIIVKKVLFCNSEIYCQKTVNLSSYEIEYFTHHNLFKLSHIIINGIFLTTGIYQSQSHK
jgi:hypothetical protein